MCVCVCVCGFVRDITVLQKSYTSLIPRPVCDQWEGLGTRLVKHCNAYMRLIAEDDPFMKHGSLFRVFAMHFNVQNHLSVSCMYERKKKRSEKIESPTYIQNHVSGVYLCLRLNGFVQTSTYTFIVCNI